MWIKRDDLTGMQLSGNKVGACSPSCGAPQVFLIGFQNTAMTSAPWKLASRMLTVYHMRNRNVGIYTTCCTNPAIYLDSTLHRLLVRVKATKAGRLIHCFSATSHGNVVSTRVLLLRNDTR